MIKYYNDLEQRSDKWFRLREENPLTASKGTTIKTQGAGLETLCWEAVAERFSDHKEEKFTNFQMERGVEQESILLGIFELESKIEVSLTGFVTNDKYKGAGASPDGFTEDATVEVKSFNKVKYLKLQMERNEKGTFTVESKYYDQIQFQSLIMGKRGGWYVIGNANNTKEPVMWQWVENDPVVQEKMKMGIIKGNLKIKEIIKKLKY